MHFPAMWYAAVECRNRRIKLPMFVDTDGQTACLNKVSWKELAPEVDVSLWGKRRSLLGKIHGVEAQIHFGQGRTQGVNMVGDQWLCKAGLILIADYRGLGCVLIKSSDETLRSFAMLPNIIQ